MFKDRGSKFFAYAFPLNNKNQVKPFIDQLKEGHSKARHFCYAFLIQENNQDYYIANDDGEPNNSAGAPILGQIKSKGLSHVLVVVVRYFGGTKLGVSGLINAYKEAAKGALNESTVIEKKISQKLHFSCDYTNMGEVIAILGQLKVENQIKQGQKVHFDLEVESEIKEQLTNSLSHLGSFG